MPKITGIIETALYTENLPAAIDFYTQVLGLEILVGDPPRFYALSVAANHVLLLFAKGCCLAPTSLPGGTIPPHDGSGPVHIGFAIPTESVHEWQERLASFGIPIESRTTWDRGGISLYFRDPDGHLLELLTPGVWAIY
jgi:catechol 2,3-dioxygenase-like lactoylglutathione lyase family enzyme